MSQYLQSLSSDDFANIRAQMGGAGAVPPRAPSAMSSSSSPSTGGGGIKLVDMTEEQLDEMVQAIIANPEYARNMMRSQSGLGYISSDQIDKQIEGLRRLDKDTMKATIKAVIRMQKLCQPLLGLYNKCEAATGGYAKYIFGVLALVLCAGVLYLLWRAIHFVVLILLQTFNLYQSAAPSPNSPMLDPLDSLDSSSASADSTGGRGAPQRHGVEFDEFEF